MQVQGQKGDVNVLTKPVGVDLDAAHCQPELLQLFLASSKQELMPTVISHAMPLLLELLLKSSNTAVMSK